MTAMVVQNRLHAPPRQICNVLWIICTVCSSNTSTCVYIYISSFSLHYILFRYMTLHWYIYICVIMGHHDEHLNLRREKQHLHTWQLKKQLWNPGPKHRSKITTSPQKMRPNMRGVDSATCRRIQLEYVVVKHPTTTFTQGCELKLLQF